MREESTTKHAFDFRSKNNLSTVEPVNVKSLLYKLDIITVFKPLSREFSGMSLKTDDYRFMMINSDHAIGKQNFTICHEFYHLFFQNDFSSVICSANEFDKSDDIEYTADCFAADLLLPEFGIIDLIPPEEKRFNKITIDTLLKIEHYFLCSRTALLYRLKTMNLINSEFYKIHSKKVLQSAIIHGYSTELYKPTKGNIEVIGNYANLVNKRFQEDSISEGHFRDLIQDIGIDMEDNSIYNNDD